MHSDDQPLTRDFNFFVWSTVGLFVVVLILAGAGWIINNNRLEENRELAESTNQAFCALRDDVAARRESSVRFLRENPEGIPGIPRAVIEDSIRNYDRTLEALAPLVCERSQP